MTHPMSAGVGLLFFASLRGKSVLSRRHRHSSPPRNGFILYHKIRSAAENAARTDSPPQTYPGSLCRTLLVSILYYTSNCGKSDKERQIIHNALSIREKPRFQTVENRSDLFSTKIMARDFALFFQSMTVLSRPARMKLFAFVKACSSLFFHNIPTFLTAGDTSVLNVTKRALDSFRVPVTFVCMSSVPSVFTLDGTLAVDVIVSAVWFTSVCGA